MSCLRTDHLNSIYQILFSFDIIHPPLELNFKCLLNIFYDIEIRALWWPSRKPSGNVVVSFPLGGPYGDMTWRVVLL
jgi:hypothetical protein